MTREGGFHLCSVCRQVTYRWHTHGMYTVPYLAELGILVSDLSLQASSLIPYVLQPILHALKTHPGGHVRKVTPRSGRSALKIGTNFRPPKRIVSGDMPIYDVDSFFLFAAFTRLFLSEKPPNSLKTILSWIVMWLQMKAYWEPSVVCLPSNCGV